MAWDEILKIVGAALFSIASAGALVIGLASWLGKVWAERILRNESHELQKKLAVAQGQLDLSIKAAERELDLIKDAHARVHNDKISIYRGVVDLVAKLLANLDAFHVGSLPPDEALKQFNNFNEQRMRLYGYMAMFAPQSVMDAQDKLIDHLLRISHGQQKYVWAEVRSLALALINEVRRDVGIDKTNISYNGAL
jgi:hypothetical protein